MKTTKTINKLKAICLAVGLMATFSLSAEVASFDSDKPATTFITAYSQTFNTTWNGTIFNAQWDVLNAGNFVASDITSGYLQFAWSLKRMIYSKTNYATPYVIEADIDHGTTSGYNRGGVVIRGDVTTYSADYMQEYTAASGTTFNFNREGIAFYPTSDGNSMVVQFSGVENGATNTLRTLITVPKPASVPNVSGSTTLLNRGTIRVEDFGTSIYVYYNGARFVRINLGGLSGSNYTTGEVFDADMVSKGTFSAMEVAVSGRVAIAQRSAALRLYSATISTAIYPPDAPTIGTATVSGVSGTASVPFTAPASNGGSAITSYIATSNPGNITGVLVQSGSGTINVTGLTNGTAYTFTVKASNAAGASIASAASNSVTPSSTPGFTSQYSQNFNTTWDNTKFYGQWDAVPGSAFVAADITSGYLQFIWLTKRIIYSKTSYTAPYSIEADIEYGYSATTATINNKAGLVIRGNVTNTTNAEYLQDPGTVAAGFNREGIAFYPTSDGASMNIQFSGVEAGTSTVRTQIVIPKPAGVTSLLGRGKIKVKDLGTSIYVYYNDAFFAQIDLGGLSGAVYTSGTVYNSSLQEAGTFTGMEVETSGKVAIAQRAAAPRLYSLSIETAQLPTITGITAGNAQLSVAFTAGSDGGSAITNYKYSIDGGITFLARQTGTTASPMVITGLTNGTAYNVQIKAVNANGDGVASATSSSVTPHATNNNITVSSVTNISALTLTPVSDVVISSNTLTINQAALVNSITVAPGAKLTLSSGNTLTATNGITLQSDAAGTATFVDTNNDAPQAVSGTVQQYLTAARNWYTASPVTAGTAAGLNLGTSVQTYSESAKSWSILSSGDDLVAGKGYVSVATTGTGNTGTVSFNGTLNTGTITVPVTRTESGNSRGFNLVANPYPSYLDWSLVKADGANANIGSTIWFRTKNTLGAYTFATHNGTSGETVTGTANTTITKFIPPSQAFWIRVNANAGPSTYSTSITFKNSMRAHLDDNGNKLKAPKSDERKRLRLQVSNGTIADEALVYFDANAKDSFDNYDSPKMFNNTASVPEIYTQAGAEKLVINGMNGLKYDTEIPLGFSTLTAGDFSITANELSNFESGTKVILLDKQNPTVETELTNETAYHFSAPITAATTGRFSLLFRAPTASTGIDKTVKGIAQVFVNAANQITIIAPVKSNYAIYNAVGQKVTEGITIANRTIANGINDSGVYVVQVCENGRSSSTRVILNGK